MITSVPSVEQVAETNVRAGQRLGRFRLERVLGRRAAGEDWVARDTELDREVLVKVARIGAAPLDDPGRDRLRAEAQDMGRLSHPNVVRIYELGSEGDLVFCAMELVEGLSLREWLATRRRWREILEVLLAAGRGVAAAHAAGLVHRDLEPDNVFIGRDGRPLVSNFGLANLGGKPAYMAPERLEGGEVDALGDQFSFCVSMYEALFGVRPFDGSTAAAVGASVRRGPVPPADRRGVPRALVRLILRGLSADRSARWPSMEALITAVARAAAASRRRRRVAVAAVLASAVAGLGLWWLVSSRGREDLVRSAGESRMDRAWNAASRAELRTALARTGNPAAAVLEARIAAALDAYRRDWLAMRVEAWRATHLRGEQSREVLERRVDCLDRLADELDTFVKLAIRVEAPDVDRVSRGVEGITPVSTCADLHEMASVLPGTIDNEQSAGAVVQAEVEQAQLRALLLAGRPQDMVAHATRSVAEAERLNEPRLLASLLLLQATAQERAGDFAASETTLRRAIQRAATARLHGMVADGWIRLIDVLGSRLDRTDDAMALVPAARSAVALAGDDAYQRADLASSLGSIAYARGDTAAASDYFRAAFEGFAAARGPKYSMTTDAEGLLALTLGALGKHEEAMRHAQHAYEIMRVVHGEHDPLVGKALSNLSSLAEMSGDTEGAARYGGQAVEALTRIYGADHPTTAYARAHLGVALSALSRHREAREEMTKAEAALRRALGPAHPDVALTSLELASVLEAAGEIPEAEAIARGAVAVLRAAQPADHPNVVYGLSELARIVGGRSAAEAVPIYDEALRAQTARADHDTTTDALLLEPMGELALRSGQAKLALEWFDRLPQAAAEHAELRQRLERAPRGRR